MLLRANSRIALTFSLILLLPCFNWAQTKQADQDHAKPADMNAAWDKLLRDVIETAPVDKAFLQPQEPVNHGPAANFLNHVFLESRTEYVRQEISFSGLPTREGVFDGTFGSVFNNPTGIPFRDAFQPNSNQMYQFLNGGTREWLSPRISTNFSVRYRQDLTHVTEASPALTLLNTFHSNRRTEFLSGYMEVRGLPADGLLSGTSLRLGRQYTYGADLAAFDGATFSVNRRRFGVSVFGGRRFTYYSDPVQRAIAGINVSLNLPITQVWSTTAWPTSKAATILFFGTSSVRVCCSARI